MSTEQKQVIELVIGLVITTISSGLWGWGGRPNGRLFRRWIYPLFFSLSIISLSLFIHQFSYWLLLLPFTYKLGTHIGYGGEEIYEKLTRRLMWSILFCASAVPVALASGNWYLLIVQFLISVTLSIGIGAIKNVLASPKEEGIMCFGSSFLVPFML